MFSDERNRDLGQRKFYTMDRTYRNSAQMNTDLRAAREHVGEQKIIL
jgi:hypothetical protein